MKIITVFFFMFILSLPVLAVQDKGKGAGGTRTEHASKMGLEKGNAWAGSKEKKEKGNSQEKVKKEKKEKKAKK
ncbi:MAG: hypothetical protein OQL19_12725 [Gammaproteobacteria bacterium]|nr:hypothetical protein [Gammaproteobacteria bacterium]